MDDFDVENFELRPLVSLYEMILIRHIESVPFINAMILTNNNGVFF